MASKHQIGRQNFFGARHALGNKCALVVLRPLDIVDMQFLDMAMFIADKFFARGQINTRVVAKTRRCLFLSVVELVNLGPLRPGIVGLPRVRAGAAEFPIASNSCSHGASTCRHSLCRYRHRRMTTTCLSFAEM